METPIARIKRWIHRIRRLNSELLWAEIYHDTLCGIPWRDDISSISPGRWAVGYNYLYVMTRILNDVKPKNILEFGLGASTSLISAYVKYNANENIKHTLVEHDRSWIDFYTKGHQMPENTRVELHEIEWCDSKKDYAKYKDLERTMNNQKFDLISVDAPFGTERTGNVFNRADILNYLPTVLQDQFVIIYDDANRSGEQNTINRIQNVLSEHGIEYVVRNYAGEKDCCLIASMEYKFLGSL